mgnify:CR=1 FL=1
MHKDILVIDDNPDIRFLICNILKEQNFAVRSAANYDQAVLEINKKGLNDFRGMSAGIGSSFADSLIYDIRNEFNIMMLAKKTPKEFGLNSKRISFDPLGIKIPLSK